MKRFQSKTLIILILIGLLLAACASNATSDMDEASTDNQQQQESVEVETAAIQFVDDIGNTISLAEPCESFIVLYSAHTENLYSLGVGDKIIGVNSTAIYPPDAATKPVYDYNSDPEKVIAAEPDCLIIRPYINRKTPDFVSAIEKTDITVISLYPDSFDLFDEYILQLGMVTGAEEKAEAMLDDFYDRIDEITEITESIEPKKSAYFESTQTNYRTVTTDSMPARAIELAGGVNIASDVEPITEGSSIASYGIEKILMHADEIDVYISQRGAMNAGGNEHSISIRAGFENIKAVKNGAILEINQKLISSPTFRYSKGVYEVARALYPEVLDEIDSFRSDELITREGYAAVLVRFAHKQIYVPSSSRYYQQEHSGHTYGMFQDVPWDAPSFDVIETAVLAGLIDGKETESDEFFDPEGLVSMDDLAKTIFILGDYARQEEHVEIKDLDECENARIVQILVDNNVLDLENGYFYPQQNLTYTQVIDILQSLEL